MAVLPHFLQNPNQKLWLDFDPGKEAGTDAEGTAVAAVAAVVVVAAVAAGVVVVAAVAAAVGQAGAGA